MVNSSESRVFRMGDAKQWVLEFRYFCSVCDWYSKRSQFASGCASELIDFHKCPKCLNFGDNLFNTITWNDEITEKQTKLLHKLGFKNNLDGLTKKEASTLIGLKIKEDEKNVL